MSFRDDVDRRCSGDECFATWPATGLTVVPARDVTIRTRHRGAAVNPCVDKLAIVGSETCDALWRRGRATDLDWHLIRWLRYQSRDKYRKRVLVIYFVERAPAFDRTSRTGTCVPRGFVSRVPNAGMGLANPLLAVPHLLAAAFSKLRGGEDEVGEAPEKATTTKSEMADGSSLVDAPEAYRGEEVEAGVPTPVETSPVSPTGETSPNHNTETGLPRIESDTPGNARTTGGETPCSAAVPWDSLPDACVQRVFLHAGFRAALNAGATCTSWQRVLDSNYFWRRTHEAHFDRGAEDKKSGGYNEKQIDWRSAFSEATRASRRWATGRCVATSTLVGHNSGVIGIATDRDSTCVVSASKDGSVVVWCAASGAKINAWKNNKNNSTFAFCKKQSVCVVGDTGGNVAAYDVIRGMRVWRSEKFNDEDVSSTACSIGTDVVVVGFANGDVTSYDLWSGDSQHESKMSGAVTCVTIASNSASIAAAAGVDVAAWEMQHTARSQNQNARWLVGHNECVRVMRFVTGAGGVSASGLHKRNSSILLTAGDDATTRVWDVTSGELLLELEGPPGTTEAEHAGQVPVEWTYTPPPGITALDVWCGLVVEGRADGTLLVWTGALEDTEKEKEKDTSVEMLDTVMDVASPVRRIAPATYRRWWAHDDAVTQLVVGSGRVVSTGKDGATHVLALGAETLAYAARWGSNAHGVSGSNQSASDGKPYANSHVVSFAPFSTTSTTPSPPRRRSSEFFEHLGHAGSASVTAAARGVATRAWRGGEFAGAAAAAAARRTAESWSDEFASAAAVGTEAWRVADRLSGGVASKSYSAADRAWCVGVSAGVSLSSAAASAAGSAARVTATAAAETAETIERIANEVGRSAHSMSRTWSNQKSSFTFWRFDDGEAFFPGFGFGGGARGWTFREHGEVGVFCVSVTGQLLITGDANGNIVVRHFGGCGAIGAAA